MLSTDQSTSSPGRRTVDPRRLAAAARSILSCPDEVQLVVDGIDDISEGIEPEEPGLEPSLRMQDLDGHPVFSCPPAATLARAAREGRNALVTIGSGLGPAQSPDREATLTLTGTLETWLEECECCTDLRARVALRPSLVLLARTDRPQQRLRVPLQDFAAPDLQLNRGFLQRSAEHANECHQYELRQAVATTTDSRITEIAGVHLSDLRSDRVTLQWVDLSGAHCSVLHFPRAASAPEELGEMLREELHAGLC